MLPERASPFVRQTAYADYKEQLGDGSEFEISHLASGQQPTCQSTLYGAKTPVTKICPLLLLRDISGRIMASGLTILLVEDESNDALLAQLALHKILPEVILKVVTDGLQAVEYLRGSGAYQDRMTYPFPDLVLLDLKLPIMDGVEVLQWIRHQPDFKLLPVIALTGSTRTTETDRAFEAGANFCVLKSQGFRRLAELVMQLTGWPELSEASNEEGHDTSFVPIICEAPESSTNLSNSQS